MNRVDASWGITIGGPVYAVHGGAPRTAPDLPRLHSMLTWHVRHPSVVPGPGRATGLFASRAGDVTWRQTRDPAVGSRLMLDLDTYDEVYGHMADYPQRLQAREVVEEVRVEAVTLDEWAGAAGLPRIVLLSLALEGGELDALQGAEALLRQGAIPLVRTTTALRALYRDQPTFSDVDAWLGACGYRLVDCHFPWTRLGGVDRARARGQRPRWTIEGVALHAHRSLLEGDVRALDDTVAAATVLAQSGYGSTAVAALDRHPEWPRAGTLDWLDAWGRPDQGERRRSWVRSWFSLAP